MGLGRDLGYKDGSIFPIHPGVSMSFHTAYTLGAALSMAVPALLQAGTAPSITTQPAAAASGYSSDHRTKSILDSGGRGFLKKPFAVEELAREVRRCLDFA